jgi:hypothetical protein
VGRIGSARRDAADRDPRGIILGVVPIPNSDLATTNFAFGGPDNQYIYFEGAISGTFWKFKAPYPGLIGPGGVRWIVGNRVSLLQVLQERWGPDVFQADPFDWLRPVGSSEELRPNARPALTQVVLGVIDAHPIDTRTALVLNAFPRSYEILPIADIEPRPAIEGAAT